MDVADGPALDVLAIARMLDQARDLDAARLVHLVAGDDADLDAALPRSTAPLFRLVPPCVLDSFACTGRAWPACRSRLMVLIRAMSRLALRISLGVSSVRRRLESQVEQVLDRLPSA